MVWLTRSRLQYFMAVPRSRRDVTVFDVLLGWLLLLLGACDDGGREKVLFDVCSGFNAYCEDDQKRPFHCNCSKEIVRQLL